VPSRLKRRRELFRGCGIFKGPFRFFACPCGAFGAARGHAAAVVAGMPPKKSKEAQRLAGKQKLEAFKRQRAEAAAAKASATNRVEPALISDPSNATESSSASVPASSKAGEPEPDDASRLVTELSVPDAETPSSTPWTAATASPFGEVGTSSSAPSGENAGPVANTSAARPDPDPPERDAFSPLDGSVFQPLPGSNPGSPSPSFGDLQRAQSTQEQREDLESPERGSRCAAENAEADLAASRRAAADAEAARARAEAERDAARRRADALEARVAKDSESNERLRLSLRAASLEASDLKTRLDASSRTAAGLRSELEEQRLQTVSARARADAAEASLETTRSSARELEAALRLETRSRETAEVVEVETASKIRAAELRASAAEDDQLRAEEDAATARAELELVRLELAEVLETNGDPRRGGVWGFERTLRTESGSAEENSSDPARFHAVPAIETVSFDAERTALVSEIRASERKLDASRKALSAARDEIRRAMSREAESRDALAAVSRKVNETTRALEEEVAARARLQDRLDAREAAPRGNRDGEDSAVERDGDASRVSGDRGTAPPPAVPEASENGTISDPAPDATTRRLDAEVSTLRARISTLETELSSVQTELSRADARFAEKVAAHNASLDHLLREIDQRDVELERVDRELEETVCKLEASEKRVAAAAESARSARVRNERLVEMLEEQAAWGEEETRVRVENETREEEERRRANTSELGMATVTKKDATSDVLTPSPPTTPSRADVTPVVAVAAAASPAAKLAAEILGGSELGRAYHPLLASIEARLLELRDERTETAVA